ncbi:hypothetical protein RJ55_07726 [Drechmeria coniospora]|nr:hypothetical protein RJ55_07726 [Drechmeria coniospora]
MWEWTGCEVTVVNRALLDSLSQPSCPVTSAVTPRKASGMVRTDRVLQLAPFTFDVSMLEIVTSLTSGACVCIPDDISRAKGPAHCIREFDVTWAFLTPSLVKLMTPELVPTLRFLVLGGEPLGKADVETWAPHLQLANGYGPTECSVAATAYPKLSRSTDPSNIGFPLGALCWLVDPEDHRRLVPPGAPGELLVHGPIVARGYFRDREKTEAAFIDDAPWLPADRFGQSRRMYKTGDLARHNCDGSLHFIGRKDSQVKLRGLRIELGEVEHQVAIHELVHQAVVILPRHGPCMSQLTAVVALKESHQEGGFDDLELLDTTANCLCSPSLSQVTERASKHLPAYMVPSAWVLVKSIPLTVSGKLNRVAVTRWIAELDDATFNLITGADVAVPASTPTEHMMQRLVGEVLCKSNSQIHLGRSFIHNGGDSILGIRLVAKLREAGVDLSVKDVLENRSLSEWAERARPGAARETTKYPVSYDMVKFRSEVLPHLAVEEDDILEACPLGPMQKGIVLSQQRGAAGYDLRIVCEVTVPDGVVDIRRLKDAWHAVSNRHTSLRTIFTPSTSEDSPCDQIVLKHGRPDVVVIPCENMEDVFKAVRSREIEASKSQPRVNFIIFNVLGSICCMVIVDHALIDGLSAQLLFRDLGAAYAGSLDTTQERRFSQYIGYCQQLDKAESLEYWKSYLRDIAPCNFPILVDDGARINELKELKDDLDLDMRLQEFCRENNVTPASLMQCAWALTLRAYTGLEDVCFGYLSSGHDVPVAEIESTVGAYINMLVCRLKLERSSTFLQLVESVQCSFLSSLPHQHCALAEIQHEIRQREPLFNTVISLQSTPEEAVREGSGDGIITFRVIDEVDPTEYDISVNVSITRGAVRLSLRHYTSKINEANAINILETFKSAIGAIIQGCHTPLAEISLLSEHDIRQIHSWNVGEWDDVDSCIHTEFSKQAAARGDTVAIDAWDGRLSYSQLDAASTLLASHLSTRGVGPEVIVPMSFEKSVWVPVTQLAVLKAGGACVAMDPNHPHKRRLELLRRCGARVAAASPLHRTLFDDLVQETIIVDQALMNLLAADQTLPLTWVMAKPNNAAFVVFTSGSTGIPKGIVLEHHALVSSTNSHGPSLQFEPGNRILQFASYTFDVSIGETVSALVRGATLCIPGDDERIDDLTGVINRMEIDVLYLTPSVASLVHPSDVPRLKCLTLGGESVRPENIGTWAGNLRLVTAYGPAECSVWSTALSPASFGASPANIGYGLGARTWITEIGDSQRLCPIGRVGELLLEGPILARGYLKDAERTDSAFIVEPLWMTRARHGSMARRLYRTGDLVRYNSDGSIHFIGRQDSQIKLHGQRIELGDIEHHILNHENIANAVVVYPQIGPLHRRLVSVISFREPTGADLDMELKVINPSRNSGVAEGISKARVHLSDRVPGYMVPSTWLVLDVIPLSVNGKTDRSRVSRFVESLELIPEQEDQDQDVADVAAEPSSQGDEVLRAVVSTALGIPLKTVSMNDCFVGLGGDSITAMQVSMRCRMKGLSVSVKEVLLSKSLRQLANGAKEVQLSAEARAKPENGAFSMLSEAHLDLLEREAKQMGLLGLEDLEDGYPQKLQTICNL